MPAAGPGTLPHRRRRHHRRSSRRLTTGAVFCAGVAALTAIVLAMRVLSTAPPGVQADAPLHSNDLHADVAAAAAAISHPIYRYSVIPGGAHNRQELRDAIGGDRVVADHYRTVALERVRVETLTEVRRAYVSYRVGDRIFWTKHRMTLPAGEPILTDGATQIRTRCGNGISYEPQLPTSDGEPDALEFEALAPSANERVPLPTTTRGSAPSAVTPSGLVAPSDLAPSAPPSIGQSGSRPPFSNETGLVTGLPGQARRPAVVSRTPGPAPVPDGHTPEGDEAGDAIPRESISMPDGSVPDGHTPDGPGDHVLHAPVPGTLTPRHAPGADEFGEDTWSRDAPIQPLPVPEPSTIVLLGTGVAGALWRRLRARSGR